jgi:phage terminase Nu1 subunit (DNA packaging protein)
VALVGVAELARVLDRTERNIQLLVQAGMPKAGHGQYDLGICMQWYIRYLQKASDTRGTDNDDGSQTSWKEEKKRLVRLQANNEELEYRRKLGELVPVDMVKDKFIAFATTVKTRVMAVPSKVAGRLEGESREVIRLKLFEALRDVLNGLAEDGSAGGRVGRVRTTNRNGKSRKHTPRRVANVRSRS